MRENYARHVRIQKRLERRGELGRDYIPYAGKWKEPDGNYSYRGNIFRRAFAYVVRTVLWMFGPLLIRIVYGAKVEGREHLKALGKSGAISVCNHFCMLDTLFVRAATGHFRSYHTAAPQNNKTGLFGFCLRCSGLLPFSTDLKALRNLDTEIGRLLHAGKIVNFYAEQSMWISYRKPRPLKRGAFLYAAKYNVPVLPIFCTFRVSPKGRVKKLCIHILPAVRPDAALPKAARVERLRMQTQAAWQRTYDEAYSYTRIRRYLPRRASRRRIFANARPTFMRK